MKLTSFLPIAILLVAVACSGGGTPVGKAALDEGQAATAGTNLRPDLAPLIKGPVSSDGLQAILGTSDVGVGENRVAFVLTSSTGLVRSPAAAVAASFYASEGSTGEAKQTALAVFHPWPYGTRGSYVTSLTFDRPGRWGVEISAVDAEGAGGRAQLFLQVEEAPSAPKVGSPAVASNSKTLKDVKRISQLTTGTLHDPDLYQVTIAQAISSGLPTVVVMTSPAFCINVVCGPQVEVLQELKSKYKGMANFIHVDLYDNSEEIQGDLTRARISPTVLEWSLPSAEWSFVIDRKGVVSARFEAFATLQELEEALRQVR